MNQAIFLDFFFNFDLETDLGIEAKNLNRPISRKPCRVFRSIGARV